MDLINSFFYVSDEDEDGVDDPQEQLEMVGNDVGPEDGKPD